MKAIFEQLCPNCNGDISDIRLSLGAPCSKCLPISSREIKEISEKLDQYQFQIEIAKRLEKAGTLKKYKEIAEIAENVIQYEEFFKKAVGSRLWSAQREWARRVFKEVSFSITAPTGLGKTVFGVTMAIFLATKGKKSYIVLPSHLLLEQVLERAELFLDRVKVKNIRVIGYHAKMSRKKRKEFFEQLDKGDFDILVTSSRFLIVNFERLLKHKFDFIFVDDVDAVLKSSKNVDRLLKLLGLADKEISLAYKIIKMKRRALGVRSAEERLKLLEEIKKLSKELENITSKKRIGCLVVSTATGKARGERVKLFRELLKFTIGSASAGYRNVQDVFIRREKDVKKQVLELVKFLGEGGLIFVGLEEGGEFAEEIAEYLVENGVRAEAYYAARGRPEAIKDFSDGETDVLVGVASYYGVLVRGLDLPHRVRYAIFTSVPKFKFRLEISEETHPFRLYVLLNELIDYMDNEDRNLAERLLTRFRRTILKLPPGALEEIMKGLRGEIVISDETEPYVNLCRETIDFLSEVLGKREVLERIEKSPYLSIKEINGMKYIFIPDVRTYIQASGRTSRLFAGGVTRGVSIVLVDDEKVFRGLTRQLAWRFEEAEWKEFRVVNWKKLLDEVDKDRELVRKIISRKIVVEEFKDPVKSVLMVVESPHKARTISSFFGRPSQREILGLRVYEVTTGDLTLNIIASKGHILDLVPEKGFHGVIVENGNFVPIYTTIRRCQDCGEQFTEDTDRCPKCNSQNISDSIDIIKALREIASEVDLVLIGTDPDVEGEKIGWDIANAIKTHVKEIKRVEFHEVTRRAIKRALENLRDIDENRVNAQLVRRIEDRWLGFVLSRNVQRAFNNKALSAGRVQTPVLGWIIERYREYKKSRVPIYRIKLSNGAIVEISGIKGKPRVIREILEKASINIIKSEEKIEEINPPPPLTTDAMLKEASAFLGFSATKTMKLAQELFESGLITYHRTDSTRVSLDGINLAREYIEARFGTEYFRGRTWATGEEGAHECIRPVRPVDAMELRRLLREEEILRARMITWDHIRLYDLIFRRFIASQMKPTKIKIQKVILKIADYDTEYEATIEIVDTGYNLILPIRLRPRITGDETIVSVTYRKEPKVRPFTQGEVVKLMREKGIGRPSTYATIIQKLLDRRYVIERNGWLIPTKRGIEVYRYLVKTFGKLVSEEVTRELEKKMDLVERGLDYRKVLLDEYREIVQFADITGKQELH